MSSIRGRLVQFHLLRQQQKLIKHIVPTIRLTQSSLATMLQQHQMLVLKPIIGLDFIKVYKLNDLFQVSMNNIAQTFSTFDEVYAFIEQHKLHQNYVIQPIISSLSYLHNPFHCFVTLYRTSNNWEISSFTKIYNDFSEGFLVYKHLLEIELIAKLAAEALQDAYSMCETIVLEISINPLGEIYIHDSYLHFPISKWNQYQLIKTYMPHTQLLTDQTFKYFLKAYETVFIKPCNGQQGKNIIKISHHHTDLYEIHLGRKKWMANSSEIHHFFKEYIFVEDCYLIQQGIPLATIGKDVFDLRVVTQKINNTWQLSGGLAKVAGDDFFVTNATKMILPIEDAMKQSSIPLIYHDFLKKRINEICLNAARFLDHLQTRKEIGFDVGITNRGEIWIIEGNYCSDISMFHQLEDLTMYKTILNNRRMVNQPSE